MERSVIEKTKKGVLTDFKGYKNLLVSFGGIRQGLGMPAFEFFNSISDIPCDKIFLRDFNQAWYQKGVDDELSNIDKVIEYLKSVISKNKYDKVCFLGNSMGGYAAILFGSILNIDCVISFAPQSYINKWNRIINFDTRSVIKKNNIYTFKEKRVEYFDLKKYLKTNTSYNTQLNIYYSPKDRLDKKHAKRLKEINNVVLHSIPEGGHSVIKTVRNSGQLEEIIKSFFDL